MEDTDSMAGETVSIWRWNTEGVFMDAILFFF